MIYRKNTDKSRCRSTNSARNILDGLKLKIQQKIDKLFQSWIRRKSENKNTSRTKIRDLLKKGHFSLFEFVFVTETVKKNAPYSNLEKYFREIGPS